MAMITECGPCRSGDHKRHYRVVRPAPEGGVGGAVCVCKGECRGVTPEERLRRLGISPAVMDVLWPKAEPRPKRRKLFKPRKH